MAFAAGPQRTTARQHGQALVYGLFVMAAAVTATYFMVYAGNLANEKTKLVNTADAVAFSAGVMHARALNFDATINRAMVANEAFIAQMVSIASWTKYSLKHTETAPKLNCTYTIYSVPVALGLQEYAPVCYVAGNYVTGNALKWIDNVVDNVAPKLVSLTSIAQKALQASQHSMYHSLSGVKGVGGLRDSVMQEVADANYAGYGKVRVDTLPITDDFYRFDGGGAVLEHRSNAERDRLKEVVTNAAHRDEFVRLRSWDSESPWPCVQPRGHFKRRGGTEMVGLDEWKAMDTSSIHQEEPGALGCRRTAELPIAYGATSAAENPSQQSGNFGGVNDNPAAMAMVKSSSWDYDGLPGFFELSKQALAFTPENSDPDKRELRIVFSIRLTRARDQTLTPDGRAQAKPSGRLARFDGAEASGVLSAVSTSEVYFERPSDDVRDDGKVELASLFNPFWQVRLRATPASTLALARVMGGPK